jgi:hypothetical protein
MRPWPEGELTRRALIGGAVATGAAMAFPASARTLAQVSEFKRFDTLPLVGTADLVPGDVLHLRVNSVFTSYHGVRPIIHAIQLRMLTSASRSSKSLYCQVLETYRSRGTPHVDPIPGRDTLQDTVRDLTDTGHTTIYVGQGEVIETTGDGCRVRRWRDIDTARYVVMRARQPDHGELLARVARAVGGHLGAAETQRAMNAIAPMLPPSDRAYLEGLCGVSCAPDVVDRYDMNSASRGFFGKLDDRYTLTSPTALDTMLYLDRRSPPRLHRDTVCSSYAALVVTLVDRMLGWRELGETLDVQQMTPAQRERYSALRAGVGCSTQVRPEWVLPAYLHLGMQVSERFEIVGQLVNVGAAVNTERAPGEPLALARPHAAFLWATREFLASRSAEERGRIQLPLLDKPDHFITTDEARMPHREHLAEARAIYAGLYAERAS